MILYSRSGEALVVNRKDTQGRAFHVRDKVCWRCGGLGGAEAWRHTGWTCYRCGGKGVDPNREIIKLYTPEQNAKLDAAAMKRANKVAAARAEREQQEQARQNAEREEMISANLGFIARIDAELAHGQIEILQSVRDWITVSVREPTDRQVEVVNKIIDQNTVERERLAGVAHVGMLKERREFTLTLLYTRSEITGDFPTIWSHWSLFTDENGCKIACKSAPWVIGLRRDDDDVYTKGQVVRVKATVVDHKTDKKGEPVTYINRPKEIAA